MCLAASILLTGCGGSSKSTGTTPPPTPATVTVTSISPTTAAAGSGPLTLTVNGTGFLSTTTVQVGAVAEPTTYVSATQVTAVIPASQIASGAQLTVIALNGSTSSGSGAAINLAVTNPEPMIASLAPASLTVGATSLAITVTGTGFVPTTAVNVNGAARTTAFVSSTQLTVALTSADVAAAGSLALNAVNPTPGGGTSTAALAVTSSSTNPAPGPTITLTPSLVLTGATTPTTITVTGSNFTSTSTVEVNGTSRSATYISPTKLTFQLTVSDQANPQLMTIFVFNPPPGGGPSSEVQLEILTKSATPVITQVQPAQIVVGSAMTNIVIYGSNFFSTLGPGQYIQTSTALWNGTPLTTLSGYPGYNNGQDSLTVAVPANLLTSLGTASVTVTSTTATPAVSNAVKVSITNPPAPTLTSIYPGAGPINTAATVTLQGTGFTSASTVTLNGNNIAATYLNSGQLTVAIPASSLSLPGNIEFAVTTPAPGGGTSAPLPYTAYIAIANNSMVYNQANGLFYVSVPSSAGAPYGNSVVSVDPATGAFGTPIPVGSEPNQLAISSDGTILWVGLDGASAVRQVDLTTGQAGIQFPLGGNGGIYQNPATALALAALPGSPNSVVVATEIQDIYEGTIGIYDSGVLRGSKANASINGIFYALLTNGTKSEIYAGGSAYQTFTYNSAGLAPLATAPSGNSYVNDGSGDMQIANGILYTDSGQVFDAESGDLKGTFYASANNPAQGPTVADTTLGLAFTLDNSQGLTYDGFNQIQSFNLSDYTSRTAVIPVGIPTTATSTLSSGPSRMTRWGTNGLAFQTAAGVISLRSNLVKDLSAVNADLGVTIKTAGGTTTGSSTTFTVTVANAGPSAATNVALTAALPSSGVLVSVTPSIGACSTGSALSCDLGGIASGGSVTVAFVIQQTTAGASTITVQALGSETDPTPANNTATSTVTVTGSAYNLTPTLSAITPAAIQSGSKDTTITITGAGFNSASTVLLGATQLASSFTSSTELTATVPAASLADLGWAPITISNPTPGGGTSNILPLTVFQVLTVGVNHILYEPFSRKIYASVGSGSSNIKGNSIVPITPETGAIGTPVNIGSQPTKMAISDDGNSLYSLLGGANSVARFNLSTQTTEFSFSPPFTNYGSPGTGFRDIAVQTGSEDTIAVDFGYTSGMALIDVDPSKQTAAIRGTGTSLYTGSSLHFYDPDTLYLFNIDTWQTLDRYPITSAGFNFPAMTSSTLLHFGTFQLQGKLGFADAGGLADITTTPATQLGYYSPIVQYGATQKVAADASLGQAFFLTNTSQTSQFYGSPDGIVGYNATTFMPDSILPLGMQTIEGANASYTGVDLIRWGQDGLAALTSGGHIYLLRGPVVVPQLLNQNSAATLTSSSSTSITHGAGNTILTLTGSNFLPGVAVTWNGNYRTTTIVDATHVTVAIPVTDLATAGSASLVAVNPGASASSKLTVTIN